MAIVKFITEQICKLYIDREFVDVIDLNNIYKVELDTGSYLIEILDNDDTLIKKYTLMIQPDQKQILQQLCSDEETLTSTIEKIKNDSTVCFKNNRLRFKHNGKYGYLNSRYEVIIAPEFTSADDFRLEYALVSKDFQGVIKVSIIDLNGNLCLGKWFDVIGEDEKTILLSHGSSLITIDKLNLSTIAEYSKYSGCNNRDEDLIPIFQNIGKDIYCGFIDRTGKIIVPLIYDSVEGFDIHGFAKVKRFGNERAVDRQGNLYYSLDEALKDGKEQIKNSLFCENADENRTYTYKARKLSREESQNRDFEGYFYSDKYFYNDTPVREGNKWGLMEPFYGEEDAIKDGKISYYKCDNILYFANGYFAYRIDDVCVLIDFENDEKRFSYRYDWISPVFIWQHTYQGQYDTRKLKSVIVRKDNKYGLVASDGKILLQPIYEKIEPTDAIIENITGSIGFIWKDGKCAIVNLESGNLLTDFIYEKIKVNPYTIEQTFTKSTFMICKEGLFGILDIHMQEILPTKYNRIDYEYDELMDGYRYKMKLYLNEKVGVYEYRKYFPMNNYERIADYSFHCNTEFDECEFLNHKNSVCSYASLSYVGVRKDNKWGILDAEPACATYFPVDDSYWSSDPNIADLDYKYESLEELISDAEQEFKRRKHKHYRSHNIIEIDGMNIISTLIDE